MLHVVRRDQEEGALTPEPQVPKQNDLDPPRQPSLSSFRI